MYRRKENNKDKYVVAFAGTDPWNLSDHVANVEQAFRKLTGRYVGAHGLASKFAAMYGTENLHLVGHSLGGGMAASAAIVTGVSATTFNPAGVHPIARSRNRVNWAKRDELITTYCVWWEFLTTGQDIIPVLRRLIPSTTGHIRTLHLRRQAGMLERHGMAAVIEALELALTLKSK